MPRIEDQFRLAEYSDGSRPPYFLLELNVPGAFDADLFDENMRIIAPDDSVDSPIRLSDAKFVAAQNTMCLFSRNVDHIDGLEAVQRYFLPKTPRLIFPQCAGFVQVTYKIVGDRNMVTVRRKIDGYSPGLTTAGLLASHKSQEYKREVLEPALSEFFVVE